MIVSAAAARAQKTYLASPIAIATLPLLLFALTSHSFTSLGEHIFPAVGLGVLAVGGFLTTSISFSLVVRAFQPPPSFAPAASSCTQRRM